MKTLNALQQVVIDTNVILDLWLYIDPRVEDLRHALECGELHWVSTPVMREELARVLQYPHIQLRLEKRAGLLGQGQGQGQGQHQNLDLSEHRSGQFILAHMDRLAHFEEAAPKASYVCKDADDQKFIDLAQVHQALLISKDKAVLSMKNRMARVGVQIMSAWVHDRPKCEEP